MDSSIGIPFAQKKVNGGFENAYYVSFAFDTCGDEDTGAIYRAKLRAQALHCSLPETSLAAFQRAATRMDDVMPEKVAAYHQQFGDHPEKSGDYECSAILRQTPSMPDCNQP